MFRPSPSEPAQGDHSFLWNETDSTFLLGVDAMTSPSNRDRFPYDRDETLELCMEAWRENPLARRIVSLTTQYVIGDGLDITAKKRPVARFL